MTVIVALVAGAGPATAAGAGLAMLLLQTSIGAVNDVLDEEHDRIARPEKPIPSGRVTRRAALAYAVPAAGLGLLVATALSPLAGLVGAAGLACGLAYDARLSRTVVSFVPFAIGIPLLPVFAWAAATGTLPGAAAELLALGPAAGTALAVGNGLVDIDDDAAAGRGGIALRLGRGRAFVLLVACELGLLAGAGAIVLARPATIPAVALGAAAALVAAGTAGIAAAPVRIRERGWEAQALGVALLALVWLAAAAPRLFS